MSSVAANTVASHENSEDNAEGAEDEKRNGERDLLDGRSIVDGVRSLHHNVLVRYRECVIHISHFSIWGNSNLNSKLGFLSFAREVFDESP